MLSPVTVPDVSACTEMTVKKANADARAVSKPVIVLLETMNPALGYVCRSSLGNGSKYPIYKRIDQRLEWQNFTGRGEPRKEEELSVQPSVIIL